MKNEKSRKEKFKTIINKIFVTNIELKIAAVFASVIFWLLIGYFFGI